MGDVQVVKGNIIKMLQQNASEQEIDIYVASQGMTSEDLQEDKHTFGRAAWQAVGGAVGGTLAAPGVVTTPVGVGLGSAIFGQAHDIISEAEGRKVPETLPERALSAAEDFSLDVVLPVGISKAATIAKKGAGAVVGKARGVFKPGEYEAFRQFGVKPSAATATQSRGLAVAEHALGDFPITADILQKHAQKNIEQLTIANKFLAKEYGPILSREEIGTLLKKATPNVLERYTTIYEKLFSKVSEEIGTQPQSIKNTVETFKILLRESQEGPSTGVIGMAKEIAAKAKTHGGGLSWKAIKDHRTKIGDLMRDPTLVSTRNIQSGHLKRIYKALTMDMEEAALAAGEKSHARWRAANKYFETKLTRDIPILEDIIKKKYPEEVFDAVMRSSKKGGTRLNLLRKQLTEKEWDAVAGTVLGKLGIETPGAATRATEMFSPTTFMTRWKQLSTSAKRALFRGGKYESLSRELDKFVRVAGDMKAVEALANKSRTGSVLMFYGLFQSTAGATGMVLSGPGGLATGVGVGTMTVAVPRLTAKLLTNDKFVRWINQGFRIAKANPNAMSTHLGRLMYLRFNEDIQEDVDNVIRGFIGE
jgi:hypothetical protein